MVSRVSIIILELRKVTARELRYASSIKKDDKTEDVYPSKLLQKQSARLFCDSLLGVLDVCYKSSGPSE